MDTKRGRVSFGASALVSLLCLGAVGACGRGGEREEKRSAPPAVILISLDTFRADRIELYGAERATAPNIASLGEESLTFTAAAAQATQTLISHKSILTGKYPLRLIRETTNADTDTLAALEDPSQFLINTFQGLRAEPLVTNLRQSRFRTAAFVDGGWMAKSMGFARGFDEFDEEGGGLAGILPRAYRWLEQNREERFFLFLHAYDLHCPYVSREPYDSRFCSDHTTHIPLEGKCAKPELLNTDLTEADRRAIADHYDGGIASADAYIAELVEKLRELGLYEESVIILTSDHGDSFGEHGQIGHGGLQLEQLLVPLVVKLPASWNVPPRKIREPVALVDVMPTVCDLLDVQVPEGLDGRSLMSLVSNGEWERRYVAAQTTFRVGRRRVSRPASGAILVPGRWLFVHDPVVESTTLFDLAHDPRALSALDEATEPSVKTRLMGVLRAVEAGEASGTFSPIEDVSIDEDLRRELESLGYLK